MRLSISSDGGMRRLALWLLALACGLTLSAARSSAQQTTPWVKTQRAPDELRFLFSGSVERYRLSTKSWLPAVTLPRTGATAFAGDATGAFVCYGTTIYRYAADFTGEEATGIVTQNKIGSLLLDGQWLLAMDSREAIGKITLYNRTGGAPTGTRTAVSGAVEGFVIAPGLKRIFGRSVGYGMGDIQMCSYSGTGVLSEITVSPRPGTYTDPGRVFLFPDESRVLDNEGKVYSTADLSFKFSIPLTVTDVDWNGSSPVVLSGNELVALSPALLETGRAAAPAGGAALAVIGTEAFVFSPGDSRPAVQAVPLSGLKPRAPLDPFGLAFTPDDAFMDADQNIVLLSRANASLFRWSTTTRSWLPTIPLIDGPLAMAWSPTRNAVFTAQPNQVLWKMDLSSPAPAEVAWAALPDAVIGMAAAGDLVFAATRTITEIFSADGTLAGPVRTDAANSRWSTWDPVRRRMYHYRDGWSPDDLLYDVIGTNGIISSSAESPYHGQYTFYPPLRVSPDGNVVVTGAGPVFNASDLTLKVKLPSAITDVVWKDAGAFTLRPFSNTVPQSVVQTWPADFSAAGAAELNMDGIPFRLFRPAPGNQLVAVTVVNGVPRFTVFHESLDIAYVSPSAPLPPGPLTATARTVNAVSFSWTDRSDNEDGFRVEYRPAGSTGDWTTGTTVNSNATMGTVGGLPTGTAYEFRVVAFDGQLGSPSAVLKTATLADPNEPIGEPYSLAVSRIYKTSVSLAWRDNATNETGFRVYRSTEPIGDPVIFDAPAGAVAFTDAGLNANTTYYYRVQAVNGALLGDLSAQVSAKTLTVDAAPTAPFNLAASAITATEATLTWMQNTTNEDEFIIEYRLSSGTTYTEAGRVPFNTTSFRLTGLTPGVSINARVKASNAQGATAASSIQIIPLKLGGTYAGFSMRGGNVQYFAYKGTNRIERYDLTNRVWLAPVPAEAEISALWVDSSGIFAAEDTKIIRWSPDGANRTVLATASSKVTVLLTTGDVLGYARQDNPDNRLTTLNKNTGAALSFAPVTGPVTNASVDPVSGRAFLRGNGRLTFVDLSATGTLVRTGFTEADSSTGPVFLLPSSNRVLSPSGYIFSGLDLASIDSLGGGGITDLALRGGDVPVVLRGDRLRAYTGTFVETGSVLLNSTYAKAVAVDADDALVFLADGSTANGMAVRVIPLSQLNAPLPGQPLDPNGGLAFKADDVFLDKAGTIQIFSKALQRLIPWSPALRTYQTPVPLAGAPGLLSYDAGSGTLLTKYGSGDIRKMALPAANPVEVPVMTLSGFPMVGLAAAGEFIYASSDTRSRTYSSTGAPLSDRTGKTSRTNVWDPVRRRVYHYWDDWNEDVLIYELMSADGRITSSKEASLNGAGQQDPIRVSPDGNLIFIGSGRFFKADDLTQAASIPIWSTDAAWRGQTLFTIRAENNRTQLQSWSGPNFTAGPVMRDFPGTPIRVIDTAQGLVVMTFVDNAPHFNLLNESLGNVFSSPYHPLAPGAPAVTARGPAQVSLKWTDLSENEDGFILEYRAAGSQAAWASGGIFEPGITAGTVSGLSAGTAFEFRVRAWDGNLSSPASAVVTATTLTGPDQPVGEPYNLRVIRLFENSVTLSWNDNASNETGFRIFRSTVADGAAVVLEAPAGATSFTDAGRSPNTTYYYRVQAVNGAVAGDLSAQISTRTLTQAYNPSEPLAPEVSGVTATSVVLTWTDRSLNEERFVAEYAEDVENAVFKEGGSVPFNTTSLTVTGLKPDTNYLFRVRAVNETGSNSSSLNQAHTLKMGGEFLGQALRAGSIYYFAFSGPDRVERFDLQAGAWLPALAAESEITSLSADESGVYTGEGSRIIHWNPQGTVRRVLYTAERPPGLMTTLGDLLIFENDRNLGSWISLNKLTGSKLADFGLFPGYTGLASHAARGRVVLSSPWGPAWMEIAPDGTQRGSGRSLNSPTAPPSGDRPILFPDGGRFAEAGGNVFSSDSANLSNSLGAGLTDVAFLGNDVPIVLRGDVLVSFTNTLLKVAEYPLGTAAGRRVAVEGGNVLVFLDDVTNAHGFSVKTVPLSALNPPVPNQNLNPEGLPYRVDEAFLDNSGLLRLYSRSQPGLFTWSPTARSYQPTLPLAGVPERVVYSPESDRLYFSYHSPFIRQRKLSEPVSAETAFATAPWNVTGIQLAGNLLMTSQYMGTTMFKADGSLAFQTIETYLPGSEPAWDPVNRRMYHFPDGVNPGVLLRDRIATDGTVTMENPWTFFPSDYNPQTPIRISPDGARVVIGTGRVFESSDLTMQTQLSSRVADVAWPSGQMTTLEPGSALNSVVQRYTPALARAAATTLSGTPVRLFALPSDQLLAITSDTAGRPRFHILDAALTVIFDSGSATEPPASLTVGPPPAPVWNSQTGLWEQTVRVRNDGPGVGSVRIDVSGLPAGAVLHNASSGLPSAGFITYGKPLDAGKEITIVLQYEVPAGSTPAPTVKASASSSGTLPLAAAELVRMDEAAMSAPGVFALKFSVVPGSQYMVQYLDRSGVWTDSPPALRAAGTQLQWIDTGAPRTTGPPGLNSSPSRFYRVKQLTQP